MHVSGLPCAGLMDRTLASVSLQAVGAASLASHSSLRCKQTSWREIGRLTARQSLRAMGRVCSKDRSAGAC